MKVTFDTVGDFEQTLSWLNKVSKSDATNLMDNIGREGVKSLRANTPVGDTGQTASGWNYAVEKQSDGVEVYITNNAHPEAAPVNIARLIDSGHGTGTGGYVPPRPYIRRSMQAIFKNGVDRLVEEMIK
jgi:hypothetical protein